MTGEVLSPNPVPARFAKVWIPGLFLTTLGVLWSTGALGRSFTSSYLLHGFCYLWNPRLLWTHLVSDALIAVAYFAISTTLGILVFKARGEIPFSWMFLAFGLFIVACGVTHILEIVTTLWSPLYWLAANVKVVTAVASVTTAVALPPLIPAILMTLRSARLSEARRLELERAHALLQGELAAQGATLEELARDVADRNRELADSRQRLYVTLKSIGDAVMTTDAEGCVSFMNDVAEELTGWSLDDAKGHDLAEVFHIVNEYTRKAVENPVEKVRRTKSIVGLANHTVLLTRDGREVSIDDSGAPILDNEGILTGIILTFRDITDRRQAEEARILLAAIVDSSDDAIVSRDLAGKITSWNKGAEVLYGYSAAEAIGKPATETSTNDEETQLARDAAQSGRRLQHVENRRTTKTGESIEVSLTISPIYDYAGRLIGTASIGRDVTMRKQTEEALRTSEKLAATGRLAATIAHEINNPLEAVMNLLYLIDIESTAEPVLHGYAIKAQEELRRVVHITRQTLAFYRDTTKPLAVDIHEVASGIVEIYQRDIQEKELIVEVAVAPGLRVEGFPGELRQVFSNLIRNAIEAVPAGGRIWIEGRANGDGTATVSVRDSGHGISAAEQARIFEPFFTTKGVNGTGLGLWVSQGIVQKHGGHLSLTSPVGQGPVNQRPAGEGDRSGPGSSPGQASKGAEFRVTLPVAFSPVSR